MRLSRYVSVVPVSEGNLLIYNALDENFIVAKDVAGIDLSDIDALKELRPELYTRLEEAGAIVADDFDEVKVLSDRIEAHDNSEEEFHLHINPTLDCNFNCWYCYENHLKGSGMEKSVLESSRKAIEKIADGKGLKTFHLSFFGGEPLMKFDEVCIPLIDTFTEECKKHGLVWSTHFTSNAFLLTDAQIEYLKDKNCSFQITLDGNREQHDKTRFPKGGGGSFDKIVENVKKLLSAGISVVLRFNYTEKNLDSISDILPLLSEISEEDKKWLSMDFQRVWQDSDKGDPEEISERVFEITEPFRDKGINVKDPDLFDYVTGSCYGDRKNYALINFNGDIYSCTARDFKKENRTGVLSPDGDIVWIGDAKENRMKNKFTRPFCHECRIAPICGGGCRQKHTEQPEDRFCIFGEGDSRNRRIDNVVLTRFYTYYIPRQ